MKVGTGDQSMAAVGCFVTALASLAHMMPDEANKKLTREGGFVYGNMLVSEKAAKILGLIYTGRSTHPPTRLCIIETNHYSPKVPQHFAVWDPNGKVMDPLDGVFKDNPYKIVSYRLFQEKADSEQDLAVQWAEDQGLIKLFDGTPKTDRELALILKRFHDKFIP